MPVNIEIKARVRDLYEIRRRAEALSDTRCDVIHQLDTFFVTPKGRLKLRVLAPNNGQLVWYVRADQEGPKRSDYEIFETDEPETLRNILAAAYGVRGTVKKVRYLYMVGQTRVHLDDVQGLGYFMELEVMLEEGQSDMEGQSIAEDLMQKLGVTTADLLVGAYIDLLEKK